MNIYRSLGSVFLFLIGAIFSSSAFADGAIPSQLRLPLIVAKGGRIFVHIKLDNVPVVMLVDAGTPQSFVHGENPSKTDKDKSGVLLGLGGGQSMAMARNVEMDFGQTISATVSAKVIDLSTFRDSTVKNDGWPVIAGALGADVLSAFGATIDYEQKLLILNVPKA
jgi:hypothetical protein